MEEEGEIENQDEQLESRLLQVNELKSLYNLHHDVWDETLLEPPFLFYYLRILHPRERQVVDGKIKGKSIQEIATEMGLETHSVMRYIYSIRYIFRNKARRRVNKFWNLAGKTYRNNTKRGRAQ
jgi:DNA-binding CsgD family transcriptional regulator